MPVASVYVLLIIIWSTTPLAIQWSGQGPGFVLGLTLRLLIGTLVCYLLLLVSRQKMSWSRTAMTAYAVSGIGIFGTMMLVYWGAQHIPSGVVSVIFGMTPLFTAFLAYWILSENSISASKILGIIVGLLGLGLVFVNDLAGFKTYGIGVLAVVASTALHSLSMVLSKRFNESLSTLDVTTGGLVFSLPLVLLAWFVLDGHWPEVFPVKAAASILYLGIIATGIGFNLYYFVLQRVSASCLALVPLITPVAALLLGAWVNREVVTVYTIAGATLIIAGLSIHLFKLNPFAWFKLKRASS